MNSVERKRAIRFANFIKTKVPKKNFDINNICKVNPLDENNPYKQLKEHQCGSVGCLIGWLPVYSPAVFKYKLVDELDSTYFVVKKSYTRENDYLKVGMKYFGLTFNQAQFCFSPVGYQSCDPSPQEAASHLLGIARKEPKILRAYSDFCTKRGYEYDI